MRKAEPVERYLDDHIQVKARVFYDPDNGLHFREFRVWVLVVGEWVEVTQNLSPAKLSALQFSLRLIIADEPDLMHKLVYGETDFPRDEIA